MASTNTSKPKRLTKPELRVIAFLQENRHWEMASNIHKTVFWLRDATLVGKYGKNKPVIATVALSLLEKGALRFTREQYTTYAYVLNPARIAELMPPSAAQVGAPAPAPATSEIQA